MSNTHYKLRSYKEHLSSGSEQCSISLIDITIAFNTVEHEVTLDKICLAGVSVLF